MRRDRGRHVRGGLLALAALLLAGTADGEPPGLAFEENRGQLDPRVRYAARGGGGALFLTDAGATVAAPGGAVTVRPAGPRRVRPEGSGRLPGVTNYLRGADERRFVRDVPSYARVSYRNVWPGIDLVWHADRGEPELDFVVSPGADPALVELALDGALATRLRDGDLVVAGAGGELRLSRPVAYQETPRGRRRVACAYALRGAGRVGIEVGPYDPARELVVDPVLAVSTYLGGSGHDAALAVARDAAGNLYAAGETASLDFPGTAGGAQPGTGGGVADAFVVKLDPTGTTRLYATYLGGAGLDVANALAVDGAGRAVVGGETTSTDFPGTAGGAQPSNAGEADGFVARLSASGSSLEWATYLGGTGGPVGDRVTALALDTAGAVLATGRTDSTSGFPVTAGAPFGVFRGGDFDSFLAKVAAGGASFAYVTYLGGDGNDAGFGVAVDGAGRAHVTGGTRSPDFPVTASAYQGTPSSLDAFLAVVRPAGGGFADLVYSTFFGGGGLERGNAVAVGPSTGRVVLAGFTSSTDLPVRGAVQAASRGGQDGFVARFDPAASGDASLVSSTYLGGSGTDAVVAVSFDGSGRAGLAGETTSADLAVLDAFQPAYGGTRDVFVARLSPAADALVFLSYLGGAGDDAATAAVSGPSVDDLFVAGRTGGSFPTRNALQPASGGGVDAFAVRLATAVPSGLAPVEVPGPGVGALSALAALVAASALRLLSRHGA